jgi:cytochrome c-type biogenesis protein CcmF
MPMTNAAISPGITRDVYVSMGEPLDGKAWAVRVYFKPFVDWIWGGALLMALGGICAVSDRRYRLRVQAAETARVTAMQGATS